MHLFLIQSAWKYLKRGKRGGMDRTREKRQRERIKTEREGRKRPWERPRSDP